MDEQETRERHFVEELGVLFEGHGSQRMMGRIVGRLLLCDPPHQSSGELADYLLASRGAISTASRALIAAGFIERTAVAGQRSTYFRIRDGAWARSIEGQLLRIRMMREVADRGVALTDGASDSVQGRMRDFRDIFLFWEQEMPLLMEHWHTYRRQR